MRILWLKTELLHPVDKGGKIRTHAMLRELRRTHHVTYLTLDDGGAADDAVARADEYCHALERIPFRAAPKFSAGFYRDLARNLASPLPWFVARYRSAAMRRAVEERVRAGDCDVVVCDFLVPAVNLPRQIACPTLLFQHNVEAAIWKRHAQVQRNPLARLYLHLQWRKAVRYERAACRRFDHVVAVSPDDREALRRDYGLRVVSDVPTGVDTGFFRPSGRETAQPHALVFTGSMDWMPNVDAVIHFATAILPRIRAAVPGVTLCIAGRDPHPDVRALAARDPSITVTGRVDDVRPYMERAAVYVVPLRVGGGTRLKIPEAMAMEMPIVSTRVGAEGLPLRHGEHLLLADDPEAFADAVVALLRDPARARGLGEAAAALARAQMSWAAATAPFDRALHAAVHAYAASAPRRGRAVEGGRGDPTDIWTTIGPAHETRTAEPSPLLERA